MSNKPKKPDSEPSRVFTVDADTGSIPSVTSLLYKHRKAKAKAPPVPQKAPDLPAPPPPAPAAPTPQEFAIPISLSSSVELEQRADSHPPVLLEQGTTSEADAEDTPTAQTAHKITTVPLKRAERRPPAPQLALWQIPTLRTGKDPLGKGLTQLLDNGAKKALFLAVTPPPTGSPVPHFIATASVSPGEKLPLWTGLKWDPILTPDTWNKFVQIGHVELAPPGTTTNMKSNRNIIRAAFGITQDEWLLLIRIGPSNTCRGVLAVISHKSIVDQLPKALALLAAPAATQPAQRAA